MKLLRAREKANFIKSINMSTETKIEWLPSSSDEKCVFAQVRKNVQIVIRHDKGPGWLTPSPYEKGWVVKIIFYHNFDLSGVNSRYYSNKSICVGAGIPYLDTARHLAEKAWREFNEI